MREITLRNVRVAGGGRIGFNGYDETHRISATLDGVLLVDKADYSYAIHHADLSFGPAPTNLQPPAGEDSTQQGAPANAQPASCAAKFAPFPQI
jgi:polygalacturonase